MSDNLLATVGPWLDRSVEFITFRYAFVTYALVCLVCVGIACGVVGVFATLRGRALLGDAAGHAALPGVCLAFLVGGSTAFSVLLSGALVATIAAALLVSVISERPRTRPDAAIATVLSVSFGLGVVLLVIIQRAGGAGSAGIQSILLGNATAATHAQMWTIVVATALIALGVVLAYRPLASSTFDASFAELQGYNRLHIDRLVAWMVALCVGISMHVVGVILVSALLIIPASTALLLHRRLPFVLLSAAAIGALSGAIGCYISFIAQGVATGPATILVSAAFFIVALARSERAIASLTRPGRTQTRSEA